jgi:hypothetical protein
MAPSPQRILVIPDLKILVCNQKRYQNSSNELIKRFAILLRHVRTIKEMQKDYPNLFWVISPQLWNSIRQYEYPWSALSRENELSGDIVTLLNLLVQVFEREAEKILTEHSDGLLNPDIVQRERCWEVKSIHTRQAWLDLVSYCKLCWRDNNHIKYVKIASSDDLIKNIHQEYVSMQDNGMKTCVIELSTPENWTRVLRWANLSLPRVGDYPYKPHGYQGDKFQRAKTKGGVSGYKDDQGFIWDWDSAHQNIKLHWHVLDSNDSRRHEITPDGRILS